MWGDISSIGWLFEEKRQEVSLLIVPTTWLPKYRGDGNAENTAQKNKF